jgi:hypothetical protein
VEISLVKWQHSYSFLLKQGLHSLSTSGVSVTASRTLRYFKQQGVMRKVLNLLPHTTQYPEWDLSYNLLSDDGTVPGRRPHATADFSLKMPIEGAQDTVIPDGIAVVMHAYYVDLAKEIIPLLKSITSEFHLYISTTTEANRSKLEEICIEERVANFEIRVFGNRGRDIAPKLVGFKDIYENHKYFLHLHTKKSPHSGGLSEWRDYLLRNLVGSEEVVKSVFKIFEDKMVGVIFPQHLPELRGVLNWGYDYDTARDILSRIGVNLSKDNILEFPSGSMFWGRSDAIRPLLDLDLSFDDFPEEAGQIDGTLAHAIERTYLFFVEAAGYRWVKVSDAADYPWPETVLEYETAAPEHTIQKVHRPLFQMHASSELAIARLNPELRPLKLTVSGNSRPRLNLLLPSVNPRSVFGGARTAIDIFKEVGALLTDCDLRVICLDAEVEPDGLVSFPGFERHTENRDIEYIGQNKTILDAYDRITEVVSIRQKDYFLSTSWWSEVIRKDISEFQRIAFGRATRSIYLIQDYESNFSQWSSRWAIAESTYRFSESLIPIINSEELYEFFERRYNLKEGFFLPYSINPEISGGFQLKKRERTILCYGRPSVHRNCFEILLDALFIWQQRNPTVASQWQIISLGEAFPISWTHPVQNIRVRGKVSLTEYAQLLSRASVGVSLMVSPHPSYPPLEMASSGLVTVSNNYDNKAIERRSTNLIGVDQITPVAVAASVEEAVKRAENNINKIINASLIEALPCNGEKYSANSIANRLREV